MSKPNPQSFGLHKMISVAPARRQSLSGEWRGLVWPQNVPDFPREVRVRCVFYDTPEKIIVGEMSFRSPDKDRGLIENYLVGGFHSETELSFLYSKKVDGVLGWGHIHFKLSPDARKLTGHIIGVSSHTGGPFYSKALLTKGRNPRLKDLSLLKRPTVFIGHGGHKDWKALTNFLQKNGYKIETFESGARAGKSISEVLNGMMTDSSIAILVMTGENETKDGELRARQNVVHEIGLSQGKFGNHRAVILMEKGVKDFSNIRGLTHIPFDKNQIQKTFKSILETIEREFPFVNEKTRPKRRV
jgi:hypothetical protein